MKDWKHYEIERDGRRYSSRTQVLGFDGGGGIKETFYTCLECGGVSDDAKKHAAWCAPRAVLKPHMTRAKMLAVLQRCSYWLRYTWMSALVHENEVHTSDVRRVFAQVTKVEAVAAMLQVQEAKKGFGPALRRDTRTARP